MHADMRAAPAGVSARSRPASVPCFVLVIFAGLIAVACSSASRYPSGTGDPNLISTEEIIALEDAGARDAYQAIVRRRPNWLRTRGPRSRQYESTILVYENGQSLLGGIGTLRGYPLRSVVSLHRLDAAQAAMLGGAGGGVQVEAAIVITTGARPL